jgi:DNA-binding LytR/AlgR family response regulator
MSISAIALDDEPLALSILQGFCEQVEGVELQKVFTRSSEALSYLGKFPVELIFLDVNMPGTNGIDFLRSLPKDSMVVFTTGHSEYAVEGFNLNAVDYLLKPFSFERFAQAIQKVQSQMLLRKNSASDEPKHFFVRADYRLVKVVVDDITLVEGYDDYVKIHQENAKVLVVRMTMRNILEKLPEPEFLRVHRSFILPLKRIEAISGKFVVSGGRQFPIGGSYEGQVRDLFSK